MRTAHVLRADASIARQPRLTRGIVAQLSRWFERARAAERVRRELGNMSERELTDIGLTRGEIGAVVNGRYRR